MTVHGPPATPGVTSQAPTPTSPVGDSVIAEGAPGPSSTHWSQAPVISPLPPTPSAAPVGSETEVCVACQGSGLLNSQVNLRLFRLIGSGQLRLGQTTQVAPATPAPAAANPAGPGNGTEVSPSLSENSGNSGRSRTPKSKDFHLNQTWSYFHLQSHCKHLNELEYEIYLSFH